MDKKKMDFYINLVAFVVSPIIIVAGVILMAFSRNNNTFATGGLVICFGALVLLSSGCYLITWYTKNKSTRREENKKRLAREKLIDDARQAFESKTDRPETNTVKLVKADIEFFAEGAYVCEKDFKNVSGNHFAFEIRSTDLKNNPEVYDDVGEWISAGILVNVGYHDGEALEKYANDNGVILQDTLENSIGSTITLLPNKGYNAYVETAESGKIDYGFIKILKCNADVLTVYFWLTMHYGLCGTVEGMVELKKDALELAHDIDSLIDKVKRKRFNTIDVDSEEVQSIKQANPFLPDSYITFLKEVGFVDFNWIDVGWNDKTPTNLSDDQIDDVKDIMAEDKNLNVDDYYFIGIDNDGAYYALSKNADDKKVYVFSHNAPKFFSYESFEEFLREILST